VEDGAEDGEESEDDEDDEDDVIQQGKYLFNDSNSQNWQISTLEL
jgi:hypothetical protein